MGRIGGWLRDHKGTTFCGLRGPRPSAIERSSRRCSPNLAFPLVLLQEDWVGETYRSLGLGGAGERTAAGGLTLAAVKATGRYSERTSAEVEADLSAVIDALERPSHVGPASELAPPRTSSIELSAS